MLRSRSSACPQRPFGKADLSDCPPSKLRRCPAIGQVTGGGEARGRVLIRGEPGNALIEELADAPGEKVVWKPGKGAFCGTDLEPHLRALGRVYLIYFDCQTKVKTCYAKEPNWCLVGKGAAHVDNAEPRTRHPPHLPTLIY